MAARDAGGDARLGADFWKLWASGVISNLGDGVALIAYPWLASAVTRNGLLIAVIAVAQRLPWLVFALPAGVITDRVDRRRLIVWMDALRTLLTLVVAAAVLVRQDVLPAPAAAEAGAVITTEAGLYAVLVVATLLLGCAEVLRDNAAQTVLPSVVASRLLEKANGRMWGAEMVANSFVGPPLGSLLLGAAFALPFFVDAGTFAVAAVLMTLLRGRFRTEREAGGRVGIAWRQEIGEGFRWLWRHPLLRPMAVILGIINALGMLTLATFVLFAQEVLGTSAFTFAVLGTGYALGGLLATFVASAISVRIGSGAALRWVLLVSVPVSAVVGAVESWPIVWVMLALTGFTGVVWNVITVSLRQTIIPDRLLGRVNSVYRFFGWGMMPIGSAVGGAVVVVTELVAGRELALRMPWFLSAAAFLALLAYAAPRLTTEKIERARREGTAAREAGAPEPSGPDGDTGDPR